MLIEVLVAVAIFLLFAVGTYGATTFVFKIVYRSRVTVLETAILSEELEVARNLEYSKIGTINGVPSGLLTASKSVMRDNIKFYVTTTVRNADDPFDGMATGTTPKDTSPADYKVVDISVICAACSQQIPISLSTQVGPKGLEGSSLNGALFINVFDADGLPVVGANVHVVNTSSSPSILIDDVTDQDGYLRIIDTPTGTAAYHITVTKNGYSSDRTMTSSVAVANPIKPPANVVSQDVTDISFSIDQISNLTVHTQNAACVSIPNIGFNLSGTKLIGKEPEVKKYSQSFTTDGSGNKVLSNMEWDKYDTSLTGNVYDIMGTIPADPFVLLPGSNMDLTLILKAHTANSLLVKVIDSGTGLPLSNASVRVTGSGYDNTLLTGVGYIRQTDWSGGSGQVNFVEGKYFGDGTNFVYNNPVGDVILKKVGNNYVASGSLESSTFDFGTTVNFKNLIVTPASQVAQTGSQSLKFQVAASNTSTPGSWAALYTGPDGTTATYYTATSTQINATSSGKRYLRYKAFLSTANTSYTPRLSELAFTYTDSCTPPGQAFFESLSATTYTIEVTAPNYDSATTTIDVSGRSDINVNLAQSP